MSEVSTIELDIAKQKQQKQAFRAHGKQKQAFRAHGADASGWVVFRGKIVQAKLLESFSSRPRCVVALEACGGAHHWGRQFAKLAHVVRLIPPAYVKPSVRRPQNDAADA